MSSSSTESGCDGSVDDRTDDESCIDDLVEEHLKKENRNANEKPLESENNSLNNSTIKKNNKPSIDNSIIAESSPNSSATKLESVKIYQSTDSDDHLLESIDDEMNRKEDKKIKSSSQTIDRESRALIDNVLKEFENPTSLYIPDKERNGSKNQIESSEAEEFPTDEESKLAPRRASGAKVSQIIKENSEILEKIMRKRVNSMVGTSIENQISLDKEEIDGIDTDNVRDLTSPRNNDKDSKKSSQPTPSNRNDVNYNVSKSKSEQPKKETGNTKNGTTHFPAVSTMGPVKPQLSKPQLNQTGGMVVQQRSDGRHGGQNSTKPITFNPFPNSSRIGQRKSNVVGRNLGLYPSAK